MLHWVTVFGILHTFVCLCIHGGFQSFMSLFYIHFVSILYSTCFRTSPHLRAKMAQPFSLKKYFAKSKGLKIT